ncbi:CRISPR system precrRNA processing endoribonuclease RAMP protein Cas6 [Enterococcus faecalis]
MSERLPAFSFTYLPLIIRLRCEKAGRLPDFLGSTLRGALGWLLLESKSDVYTYLFDNQRISSTKAHLVKPYFVEPPRPKAYYRQGEELAFSLVFLGNADIAAAEVMRILTKQSFLKIGAARLIFKLVTITHGTNYKTIWDVQSPTLTYTNLRSVSLPYERQSGHWASIQLQTPLRIRRKGQLVTDLDFPTIIRNITTRLVELTEGYGGTVNRENIEQLCETSKQVSLISSSVCYHKMVRYSNKINEKMDFSGMLGSLTFEGELAAYTPWLNAARLIHLGRNTTFGCGKLDVVII